MSDWCSCNLRGGVMEPTLKYIGKGDVIRKVRIANGKSYCVSMVDFMGCGRFKVRVSEPGKPLPFAEVSYVNFAAFMREWELDICK